MARGTYGGECIETHSVYLTDRGGKRRIAQLVDVAQVQWGRLRDATSEAIVIIRGSACSEQADILANIEPHRTEMVIYRGDQRVWEGPVMRVGWHADWVEIAAHDVSEYVFSRPLSRTWDNSYPNSTTVTARMKSILEYELSNPYTYSDDVGNPVVLPGWEQVTPPANVLPHLVVHSFPNEARTGAVTTPFQMSVGEHLDNFARSGGIDYTVIGRGIHIWDVSRALGETRTLTEADFFGEVIVTAYGADHDQVAFTTADNGSYGGAGGMPSTWRFLEKSGPAGTAVALPPKTGQPLQPSIVDVGSPWNGYRYWMAYRPTDGGNTMRVAASKDASYWVDVAERNVNANAGGAVTQGWDPELVYGYDGRMWLFFTNGQNVYRTRTENGRDWTTPVLLYIAPSGTQLRSLSVEYDPAGEGTWIFHAVDVGPSPNRVVRFTSLPGKRALDGIGQLSGFTTQTFSNPAGREPWAIETTRAGREWVALVTFCNVNTSGGDGGLHLATRPNNSNAWTRTGEIIPRSAAGKHTVLGRATFLRLYDGTLDVWYSGALSSVWKMFRTKLTGPAPEVVEGDELLDYYGPWTTIYTVYDEDESAPPSQGELNSQAKRNLSGRTPVPIEVRVPDNSGIRLGPGLSIDMLVPGVAMPLLATLNARQVSQVQKLHQVTVTETPEGEVIAVTLIPATREDSDEEDEA